MGIMSELTEYKGEVFRSITPENITGEKGKGGMAVEGTGKNCARELGKGWKISPSLKISPKSTLTLGTIDGPGIIKHFWITVPKENWRSLILRMYWDDEKAPSVEVPIGDFFCQCFHQNSHFSSLAVCANPAGGLNCYWEMPFAKSARITLENLLDTESVVYYQIDYVLSKEIGENILYFHAAFRRSNPTQYMVPHVILDGVKGRGKYVGTYLTWGVHNCDWWGEGEIKMYIDGDQDYPTICGTGTEDYFCGAWNFEEPKGEYCKFFTPYSGLCQVIRPDSIYNCQQRFGMYRWHLVDAVSFEKDIRVDVQALGWRSNGRYLPLQDDISSVAYWYQAEPHVEFTAMGDANDLEII